MATKSGLGPLSQDTTIDMGGVKYKLKAGEVAELTITEAAPENIDVERLEVDREYWDSVAPDWAESLIMDLKTGRREREAWFEYVVGRGKAVSIDRLSTFTADTKDPHGWTVVPRPPAKDDDGPDLYMCPALCGCLWRDNNDGTMSLYGQNSKSCDICEPMFLNQLIPLMATRPIKTKERQRDDTIVEALRHAPMNVDDEIHPRQYLMDSLNAIYDAGLLRKEP